MRAARRGPGDAFAFATTVPAILALALAVVIVLEMAGVDLPAEVLTFNWSQIKATWGISAVGIMLSWLTVDSGGADKGIGFWLMFLGSIAMAVGAIMALLGKAPRSSAVARRAPPPRRLLQPCDIGLTLRGWRRCRPSGRPPRSG